MCGDPDAGAGLTRMGSVHRSSTVMKLRRWQIIPAGYMGYNINQENPHLRFQSTQQKLGEIKKDVYRALFIIIDNYRYTYLNFRLWVYHSKTISS